MMVFLLTDKILDQLTGSLSADLQGFYTSKVAHDFVHQQYDSRVLESART